MSYTIMFSSNHATKSAVLREFFELLLDCFHTDGAAKNDWLMPFDPGPSSLKRKAMSGKSQ
jgi:hypothetical protein